MRALNCLIWDKDLAEYALLDETELEFIEDEAMSSEISLLLIGMRQVAVFCRTLSFDMSVCVNQLYGTILVVKPQCNLGVYGGLGGRDCQEFLGVTDSAELEKGRFTEKRSVWYLVSKDDTKFLAVSDGSVHHCLLIGKIFKGIRHVSGEASRTQFYHQSVIENHLSLCVSDPCPKTQSGGNSGSATSKI